uniref:Predicted protein n=1 Tax=Hordeum vulgare subsp. vulgare TaxID=112509 RepID=F2DVV8_HORVV|nr:predicted protein [Hordeum vulgare subsp. vulgare]
MLRPEDSYAPLSSFSPANHFNAPPHTSLDSKLPSTSRHTDPPPSPRPNPLPFN